MSRFHAQVQAHGRALQEDRDEQQEFQEQYDLAQSGLYDRDKEVSDVLEGVRPSTSPAARTAQQTLDEFGGSSIANGSDVGAAGEGQGGRGAGGAAGTARRLGRPSMAMSTSTATSDDVDDAVQVMEPEDAEPLRRFVTRSSSFNRDDFDKLMHNTGLFAVDGRADLRLKRSHLPPSHQESKIAGMQKMRRERRRRRHSSVLGLPMLRPDSTKVTAWSIVVLFSDLTYSAFIVPISIGMWTTFYEWNWTTVSDFLFGAVFFLDLLASLHVGFIATCGTRKLLVMNGRLVALHYLQSFAFVLDLFSSLAWLMQIGLVIAYHMIDSFNPNTALVVMEGIRLMRFLRVTRLIMSLLSNAMYATLVLEARYFKWLRNQTFLTLAYLMYLIAVVINFLGCLWNFTAGAEGWNDTWVNHYEPYVRHYSADGFSPLTTEEAHLISRAWLWCTGVYWALSTVATVGFGDVVPATAAETLVVIFVEVCGVLFFGLLISSISELLQHSNRNARRVHAFRNKMQSVERWMQQNMLPPRLQRRIKQFYADVWVRQHEVKEETVLFQELPHALRNEVAWRACQGVFKRVPLLRELDDKTLYLLASKMTPFRFAPGQDLATEGDPADRFWLLIEGEVVALYHYNEAERLEGPAVVGESVLLQEHEEALRTFPCTYRTLTSCICWMVRMRDFKPMLTTQPGLQELVKARALQGLSDQMSRYPSMWATRPLKRFDTAALSRSPNLARASAPSRGVQRAVSDQGLVEYGHSDASTQRVAAAVMSTLARRPQHFKSVSWGGEQLAGGPPPGASHAPTPASSWRLRSSGGADGADGTAGAADTAAVGRMCWSQAAEAALAAVAGEDAAGLSASPQLGAAADPAPPAEQQQPALAKRQSGGSQRGAPPMPSLKEHEAVVSPLPAFVAGPPPASNGESPRASVGDEAEPLQGVLVLGESAQQHPLRAAAGPGGARADGAPGLLATAAASVLPVSLLAHHFYALRQEGLEADRRDAEHEAEVAQLGSADAAPAQKRAAAERRDSGGDGDGDGGGGGGGMERMSTEAALAMLARTAEERRVEEEAAAELTAAAVAAGDGTGLGQAQVLSAVLAEVQALRRDVEQLRQAAAAPRRRTHDGG